MTRVDLTPRIYSFTWDPHVRTEHALLHVRYPYDDGLFNKFLFSINLA